MKRLVVCCDGTWQSVNNDCPTNVLKIAQAIEPMVTDHQGNTIPQILYYDEGIGAVPDEGKQSFVKNFGDLIEKVGGGAFGWWIDEKIKEAYIFLCLNYCPGDEIYLFGFSRGAYTVRSLAGLISCSGLLKRPDISKTSEAYRIYRLKDPDKRKREGEKFRQKNADQQDNTNQLNIRLLGCWDTVGALGIPNFFDFDIFDISDFLNQKYEFHDRNLNPLIQNARHAIAIDERRKAFDVTIMKPGEEFKGTLKQVWFPGDHGCVGGGTKEALGLSNAALKWMADEASELGLKLDLSLAEGTDYIDAQIPFTSHSMMGIVGHHLRDIAELNDELGQGFKFDLDHFHVSVKERWCKDPDYRPKNLEDFLQGRQYNWCNPLQLLSH